MCGHCHGRQVEDLALDAHAAAHRAGDAHSPRCVECHGSHGVLSRRDPASPTHRTNVPASCGTCHEKALEAYRGGAHAAALGEANPHAAMCTNCHAAHRVAGLDVRASSVARARLADTCGLCHGEESRAYARSVHGRAVRHRDPHAPTCADCHGSHEIPAAKAPDSPVSKLLLAGETCGRCHGSLPLTREHDLPVEVVADFRGSFHGLAGALGDRRVANCASCHGVHEILPSSDPDSSVHPANLGATCGGCHPGAGPEFARGGVHHIPRSLGHRLVDWVGAMYRMMIVTVIGLMAAHNVLDFRRRWRNRRRRHGSAAPETAAKTYLRFTRNERAQHWILASSFGVLVVTGFALEYRWGMPGVEGEAWAVARAFLHRAAAIVFMGLAAWHVGYLIATPRGREFFRAMLPRLRSARDLLCRAGCCFRLGPPTPADWRDLVDAVKHNLGLADRRPRYGRFNYAEKIEYVALLWGSAIMVGTGIALWAEEPFLNVFPYWAIELATVVHYYEAALATLAIVVWHFYFTMFNPDVFPLSKTMITGRISREEMEHEHPLELRRLEESCGEQRSEPTPTPESEEKPPSGA